MRRFAFSWLVLCAILGVAGTGYAAFSNHHSNAAQLSILSDYTPPTVTSVAQKNEGGVAGFIRSGQPFKVYANATDGGAPASGIQDVTSYAPGTNLPMAPSASSVMGVNYGYVTADKTTSGADGAVIVGTTGARDANQYQGFGPLSVTVDNTAPTPINVNTINFSSGTVGRMNAGDSFEFTYSEPIDPFSLFGTKWNWTTNQATGGQLVCTPYNPETGRTVFFLATTPTHTLGTFYSTGSYCSASLTATITFSMLSANVLRLRLSTVTGVSNLVTDPNPATMTWLTTSGTGVQPFDRAGNVLPAGSTVVESGTPDPDF